MSNRYARILAAGGAMVLVAALGVPTALAAATAKTWTVQPGGAITATAGKTTLRDSSNGTFLSCVSSDMSGTLTTGSGLPGARIGSITAAAYGCPTHSFTQKLLPHGLPWRLNLTSYNPATGVARGTIRGLQLAYSSEAGCSFVVNGTSGAADDGMVAVSYSDTTGRLTILRAGGNLYWYDVTSACLGLVNDGDRATLGATYTVSPEQAITSP